MLPAGYGTNTGRKSPPGHDGYLVVSFSWYHLLGLQSCPQSGTIRLLGRLYPLLVGKLIYGNALGVGALGAFFYLYRFIALAPVASPTKRLQIVLGRQATLGYRDNVVNFQQ